MRLSAAIMAHPSRKESALWLQGSLDRDVPIAWDPNPVPSGDPRQRWTTGRTAWEAHDPRADWHLVLQDDVLACRDLLAGLELALGQVEQECLVSAYTGQGRPHQGNVRRALARAERAGECWITTRSLNWGPAILAPVRTIGPMLEWCSGERWTMTPYDYRIGVWARDVMGWATRYTVPSLVDTGREPSLIGNDRGPARLAHQWIGAEASAISYYSP